MINFLLVIVAKFLFLIISLINFLYVNFFKKKFNWKRLSGYYHDEAIAIDKYGNSHYRSLFNKLFVIDGGYQHGNVNETISSVLGKNELFGKLTKTGKALVKTLNFIDKNHCQKSINWNV